jgi:Mn2+/Fe2+ NRAMP family transporter
MNKFLEIFLGILTAMGGFVEVGELVFSVNAGVKFQYNLLWMVALGTIGIIVYGEMSGRIAAVTNQPVFYFIRQRAGYGAGLLTLLAANIASLLTCAAEIGGIAILLKLLFGGNYYLLAILTLIFLIAVIWFLSFHAIERIFGLFGLMMVVYMVSAYWLSPDWLAVASGFIPNIPQVETSSDLLIYGYFAVALLSSIMLPYETYFYASGGIEDGWNPEAVTQNRFIVVIGFVLGSLLSVALMINGARFFAPLMIEPQLPGTAAQAPAFAFGKWGLILAILGMFFAFAGAAIENALTGAYNLAQFFGWNWGKYRVPKDAPRFHLAWMVMLILGALIILTGVDPVEVVEYSIVVSIVILPLTYLPMLLAARDKDYMGDYANGWLAGILGWFYFFLVCIAAIAAIPLLVITHGGKG